MSFVKLMVLFSAPVLLMASMSHAANSSGAESPAARNSYPPDLFAAGSELPAAQEAPAAATEEKPAEAPQEEVFEEQLVADPIEPWNRVWFTFNDKLYFWLVKPVATGYGNVVPEWGRIRVRNVFRNVTTPVRFVNALLQFKVKRAARELGHFIVNSTAGLGGMFDIKWDTTEPSEDAEDFGQTLGSYGVGNGIYVVWPLFGPSSVRDSVGLAGDFLLNPVSYVSPVSAAAGIRAYQHVNNTSLSLGEYEDFKDAAVDPYTSMKDAYIQHRNSEVEE